MKKTHSILIMIFCLALSACGQTDQAENANYPQPNGFVNDFEGILTDKEEKVLDSLVIDFEKQTQIEMVIITLDSSMTSGDNFDSYTLELANNWGVGKKGLNNGVLIAISSTLRKIRIHNGFRIEEILSDEETKKIVDNYFIPNFKNAEYFEGIRVGATEMMGKLK